MLTTILVIVVVGAVAYFGYTKFSSAYAADKPTKSVTGSGRSRTTANVTKKPKTAKPKK